MSVNTPTGLNPASPLDDGDLMAEAGSKKNFAKVGSSRPTSLLYTYGPGAIMDLPHFTIMPAGFDDWERIWHRRDGIPDIHAPRLLDAVRLSLGPQVEELRPFPWQPQRHKFDKEGNALGVPARVFPNWLRCTGCDRLAPVSAFDYTNTNPYRPDDAKFRHEKCPGRRKDRIKNAKKKQTPQDAVPARYLLACVNGHVDEFPYDWFVHHGQSCSKGTPFLYLQDRLAGNGAMAVIECRSCDKTRGLNQAQGEPGKKHLPECRGRHPHIDTFTDCGAETHLMLVGASNLWFPATQSIVVMPASHAEHVNERINTFRAKTGVDKIAKYRDNLDILRDVVGDKLDLPSDDDELKQLVDAALQPQETDEERQERQKRWQPEDLLVPEWRYLQKDPETAHHEDKASGLVLDRRERGEKLPKKISRVLAVEKLRKVNAVIGFTRIDDMERANDIAARLAPLTSHNRPKWTVATEDLGEGIFLQLDEDAVREWESKVESTDRWNRHREAHRRNFMRRFSETAKTIDPDSRLKPARYWLVHTFSHLLIREMAMFSGYSAASISERIFAWCEDPDRNQPPAAGVLLMTTASDSDGTLGGLVGLSEKERLALLVNRALREATRCSSDPVCARRVPKDPEDFLHGASCHCCSMASETSCENANRFLDRAFVLNLPGSQWGFFGDIHIN